MNWILLILAGCLELVFTFCLGKINRVFGMSGTLLVVFIACNVLLDCLLMVDIKMFPSLLVKKNEKIFVFAAY